MAPQLKVAPNELVTITGANFGAIKPNENTDVTIAAIKFGTIECFQTVTLWSATSITLQMCAASGTDLPISITLGTKASPPFATVIKVKAVVECEAGRFSSSLLYDNSFDDSSNLSSLLSKVPTAMTTISASLAQVVDTVKPSRRS
jgi:hypothetical protein